jgi:hypothetical protein
VVGLHPAVISQEATAHPRGEECGLQGCSPQTPEKRYKKTDFVGTMTSKVLYDSPCSQNQAPKSTDD